MAEEIIEKDENLTEEEIKEIETEAEQKEGESPKDYSARLRTALQTAQSKGYKKGAQKRIDDIIKKERSSAEQKEQEYQAEISRLKEEKENKPAEISDGDIVVADGKKWYSNRALRALQAEGKYDENEIEDYKDERNTAIASDKASKRFKAESEKDATTKIRTQDAREAKEKYPFLNNPEDPRYKLADRLWADGYRANPRGLSKAAALAVEMLKDKELSPEERARRSEELGVESPSATSKKRAEKVSLSGDEKELAYQIYKNLSPADAEAKALKAKKRRLGVE